MNKKKELEEHAAKLEAELLELKQSIASMPDPDEKWVPLGEVILGTNNALN